MSGGWIVVVTAKRRSGVSLKEFYVAAIPDRDEAIAAVKRYARIIDETVEARRALKPGVVKGAGLKRGEIRRA